MRRSLPLLLAVLITSTVTGAQVGAPSEFTAEDMLKVVSASVQAMSEDGRLVAITERRPYDNAEVDNYRYGDPRTSRRQPLDLSSSTSTQGAGRIRWVTGWPTSGRRSSRATADNWLCWSPRRPPRRRTP